MLVFYPGDTYNIDELARFNKIGALTGFRIVLFERIDEAFPISDDLEMALLYDLGDSDVEQVPGVTTKVGETVGVLEFDELTDTGRYFVRYLVTVPRDGHVLAGAITFDYGDAVGSGTNWYIWLVFGLFAAAALSIGAWYSLRPRTTGDASTDAESADH